MSIEKPMPGRRAGSLEMPNGGTGSPPAGGGSSTPAEIDVTKDRLSEILSARRRQLGLKIEEIAEDIKIRPDYLRAIEQEAFEKLPTPEYSRLFLKSYAERLGLNINDVYALYDVHYRPTWEPPKPRMPQVESRQPIGPTPRIPAAKPISGKVWLYLILGIIAAGLIIFGVLKLMEPSEVPAESSQAESEAASQSQPPTTEPVPAPATTPIDTLAVTEIVGQADDAVVEAEMLLVLSFDRLTWVRLSADGDSIATGEFAKGQSLQAKGLDRFVLSLGHTDGVTASANGRPLKPFSSWARELKGLVITADSIRSWRLPSQGEALH